MRPPARSLAAAAVLLIALAAGGCTRDPADDSGPSGMSEFGPAPVASNTPTRSTGTGNAASPSPTVAPAASASTQPNGAELHAAYQLTRGPLGANATVAVTITNQGTGDSAGWTVAMKLDGGLIVSPGPNVNHTTRDGLHIFTPGSVGAAISPRGTLTFTFGVTGVNVGVSGCTIDGRDCTAG